MKHSLYSIIFFTIILITSGNQAPVNAASENNSNLILNMYQDINQRRNQFSLYPLELSSVLSVAAQEQATYLAQSENLTHIGRNNSTSPERARDAGWDSESKEIIFAGKENIEVVIDNWLIDDQDNELILTKRYRHIGIAVATNNTINYWVVTLGLKYDESPPLPDEIVSVRPLHNATITSSQQLSPTATIILTPNPTSSPVGQQEPVTSTPMTISELSDEEIEIPELMELAGGISNDKVIPENDLIISTPESTSLLSRLASWPFSLIWIIPLIIVSFIIFTTWRAYRENDIDIEDFY